MTLITTAMREEYSRLLQTKGRDEARRFVFIRLQMEHNRKWMNDNREAIEKELERIANRLSGIEVEGKGDNEMRCKFCGQEMEKTMIGEHYNFRDCANYLQAELARRDDLIKQLVEDGERLASTYVIEVFPHEWVCRGGCHHWARFGEQIEHSPDCPITLHRALMKELEK